MPLTTEQLKQKYQGGASSTGSTGLTTEQLKQKYSGGTPSAQVQPTPLTEDQIQLQRLQSQKSEKDKLDLQEQSQRQGVGKFTGGISDVFQGIENSATRGAGNALTFGNEMLQKLGFNGSSNPSLNYGTESNKFATDGATAGTNMTQKIAGGVTDVGQALAPIPGAGKATALLKGTDFVRDLASSKGVAGFIGRNAPGTLKNVAEGAQGDILLTGEPDPMTTGLIAGTSALGGLLGTKGAQAKLLQQAHELFAKGDIEGGRKILANPELIGVQQKLGLGTPEGVAANREREIAQIDEFLKESVSGAKNQTKLINSATPESKLLALQFASPDITKLKGKTDLTGSYNAAGKAKEEIWQNIDTLATFLNQNKILNSNNYSIAKGSDLDKLMEGGLKELNLDLVQEQTVRKELNKILDAYKERNRVKKGVVDNLTFKDLNDLRLASNKEGNPYAQDAYDVIADAFRQKMDLDVDVLSQGKEFMNEAGLAKIEALQLFKEMNQQYGNLKDAQKIIDQMSKVSKNSNSRFQEMIGGIIATGGTYNPVAYLVGSEATKKLASALQKMTNTEFGLGAKFNPLDVPTSSENLKDFLKIRPGSNKTAIEKLRKKYGIK